MTRSNIAAYQSSVVFGIVPGIVIDSLRSQLTCELSHLPNQLPWSARSRQPLLRGIGRGNDGSARDGCAVGVEHQDLVADRPRDFSDEDVAGGEVVVLLLPCQSGHGAWSGMAGTMKASLPS